VAKEFAGSRANDKAGIPQTYGRIPCHREVLDPAVHKHNRQLTFCAKRRFFSCEQQRKKRLFSIKTSPWAMRFQRTAHGWPEPDNPI
jgi:hypothetical protein